VSRVTGPLGLEVKYEYDRYANLVRVTRDERVEGYDYSIEQVRDRHNLIGYRDPNGNGTRYEFYQQGDRFLGEPELVTLDKFELVKAVVEPEGVRTSFVYDRREVLSRGRFITMVTDARTNRTVYELDGNGSP